MKRFYKHNNQGRRSDSEPPIPRRKKHPEFATRNGSDWLSSSQTDDRSYHLAATSKSSSSNGPKKSISMGTIGGGGNLVAIHEDKRKLLAAGKETKESHHGHPFESEINFSSLGYNEGGSSGQDKASMEHKKNLDQIKVKEYKSEYKKRFRPFSQYEYIDGKFSKKKGESEMENSWFKEVIELRKKAGEYKFRGWGTELTPQHLSDNYNQQIWDQVSRRSSLAALALIATTPKFVSKEEKEKENIRKIQPGRATFSRPHTATPKHPLSDLDRPKQRDIEAVQPKKKNLEDGRMGKKSPMKPKGRSHSEGPGSRSPWRAPRQQSNTSSLSEKDSIGGGWKVHLDPKTQQKKTPARHPRPSSADPSLNYDPMVKSPPEPTRVVKSPDQVIVRSPDPVNWTVPLDTTKSFTVTQNVREAPPSPRFRSGEKLHGPGIHSGSSAQHSSGSFPNPPARSGPGHLMNTRGAKSSQKTSAPPKTDNLVKRGEKPAVVKELEGKRGGKGPNKPMENSESGKEKKDESGKKSDNPVGNGPIENFSKPIPGTTLKCLEDPTFMFDPPSNGAKTGFGSPQQGNTLAKMRVLEAPPPPEDPKQKFGFVPPAPVASTKRILGTSHISEMHPDTKPQAAYRVLEAPKTSPTKSPGGKSASGRSKASDVLEKARNKFDKFWGKSKDEEK